MSDDKRPFIEDGSQFGISQTAFEEMNDEGKSEWMERWFHHHFEDPNNETPREGGEYFFVWGGPFDAHEQLQQKFGDVASYDLIEDLATHLEQETGVTEWAPTSGGDFFEDTEPHHPIELDTFSDGPNEDYGTAADHEARRAAKDTIEELRSFLNKPHPIGLGHNYPPEEISEPAELTDLRPALRELAAEFAKPNPAIALVKRWAAPLRKALIASADWGLKKIDIGVDAAAKAAGKTIGTAAGAAALVGSAAGSIGLGDLLHKAFDAIVHWLYLVTTIHRL